MSRRMSLAGSVLLAALVLAGCQEGYMLELDVVNHSQTEIVIEVLGPGGADVGFREVVEPGGTRDLSMERPGPGGWAVAVDDRIVTDSTEWPQDNPTIDLTLVIETDGTAVVQDT